jgi:N-acetylneuraminic acid mutarotase
MGRGHRLVIICLAATLALIVTIPDAVFGDSSNPWVTKAAMPNPIGSESGHVAVLGSKIYTVTAGQTLNMYDPETDVWTYKASMPTVLDTYEVAACNGYLYVMGTQTKSSGNDQTVYPINEVYNPTRDTWHISSIALPFDVDLPLIVADNKIYAMGGYRPAGFGMMAYYDSNHVYDPSTNIWTTLAPMAMAVAYYGSAVVDDKIYVFGGANGTESPFYAQYTDAVQIYDIKINSWSYGTPLPTPMFKPAACATTGEFASKLIYVAGGTIKDLQAIRYHGNLFPNVDWMQIYSPQNDNWTNATAMPAAQSGLALVNVDDRLFALGGTNGAINLQYTPVGYGLVTTPTPTVSPSLTPSPISTVTPTNSPITTTTLPPTFSLLDGVGFDRPLQWLVVVAVAVGVLAGVLVWAKKKR